jgi:hypothetical protein
MSEDFLRARTDSWIAWLEAQRFANSAPNDAMLTDSFSPGIGEVFAPLLQARPLLPVVQTHDHVYGKPTAGGSGASKQYRVVGPADLTCPSPRT